MAIKVTTAETFQTDVLDTSGLVVVAYYIDGFDGVGNLLKIMDYLDETYTSSVSLCKVDCAGQDQLMIDKLVSVIPMMVAYKDGVKLHEFRHPPDSGSLSNLIDANM
jgi:thioredoxin-like negative regulator of GroEL